MFLEFYELDYYHYIKIKFQMNFCKMFCFKNYIYNLDCFKVICFLCYFSELVIQLPQSLISESQVHTKGLQIDIDHLD